MIDLLLDDDKTEVFLIGTQYQLNKLDRISCLRVGDNDIRSVACARNLGVWFAEKTSTSTHINKTERGLGLVSRTNRSRNVEQEAVIAIFHLYTPLMSSKRQGRSSVASQSSNQSPEEKRSKNRKTSFVLKTLVVESSSKESIDWESLTTAVTNLAQLSHVSYDIRTRKW